MSEDTTYSTVDAVNFALTGKPIEFEAAIKSILADRLPDAVEAKREEIAKTIFPTSTPAEEPVEEPAAEEEVKTEEETGTPAEEE